MNKMLKKFEVRELTRNDDIWLYLHNLKGMGVSKFSKLFFQYDSCNSILDHLDDKSFDFLSFGQKQELLSGAYTSVCDQYRSYMQQKHIGFITYSDANYPDTLRNIEFSPPVLYYIGNFSYANEESVSIIGSRHASSYGRECARYFAREIASFGIPIISGMAEGIDSCAQTMALEAGGASVAILAGGVDYVYPSSSQRLYDSLSQNGLIISEMPLHHVPFRGDFPYRNRLIIGLSKCLLVVEAAIKSGTMSTVDHALNQGKQVFAIPGSLLSPNSQGTNRLIKEGCFCATEPMDILNEFGYYYKEENTCKKEKTNTYLTKEQSMICRALKTEPLSYESLEQLAPWDAGELNLILNEMEILGIVQKNAENIYSLTQK